MCEAAISGIFIGRGLEKTGQKDVFFYFSAALRCLVWKRELLSGEVAAFDAR